MLQSKKYNTVKFDRNEIFSCDTNGIYLQGKQS